jgi:hypothetical protein
LCLWLTKSSRSGSGLGGGVLGMQLPSENPRAGQVLHINEPDDLVFSINDDHLVNEMLLKCVYGLGGEFVALDGDRVCRHVIANEMIGNVAVFLIGADKIAVGEDALQLALLVGGHHGTGLALFHGIEGSGDGVGGFDAGELVALAHDVGDAGEQLTSKAAAGVQLGKVLGLKAVPFLFAEDLRNLYLPFQGRGIALSR